MEYRLSELLGDAIRKRSTGNENTVLKSSLWKIIIEEFQKNKNIDIKPFLVSVDFSGDTIFIKTNKPIINQELISIEDKILDRLNKRIKILGLKFKNFKIRYI